MKNSTLAIGVLGAGAAFFFLKSKNAMASPQPNSAPSPAGKQQTSGGAPALVYPFRAPVPPRVDSANQPWYNGPTVVRQPAAPEKQLNGLQSVVGDIKSVVGLGGAVAGTYADLKAMFGWGDDANSSSQPATDPWNVDSMPTDDHTSYVEPPSPSIDDYNKTLDFEANSSTEPDYSDHPWMSPEYDY